MNHLNKIQHTQDWESPTDGGTMDSKDTALRMAYRIHDATGHLTWCVLARQFGEAAAYQAIADLLCGVKP